jgi:chitodextrinase
MKQHLLLLILFTGLILFAPAALSALHLDPFFMSESRGNDFSDTLYSLPLDEDGWTVITPSADSKIIYVSSSGGDDDNDGLSPGSPVATIEKASNLVRNGYPDHILLKCGDVWESPNLYRFHSGRSATEPMVVSYYGDSITRPLLLINSLFLNIDGDPIANIAFIGLEWYAWKHDPASPDFTSNKGVAVFRFVGAGAENILIEDCVARYASLGAFHAYVEGTRNRNNKLRRNIALHAWADSTWYFESDGNRIQGFYSSEADNLLIEDCLFDHNGWDEDVPGAGANMFNHNIYLQYNCSATTIIRNNIIARGAAHGVQLRGGGTCSDNLFIRNAVNLNIGGVHSPLDGPDAYSYARNNVFYEGRLMDSTNIAYPRTGANVAITILIPSTIANNIITHSLNEGSEGVGEYDEEYGLGGSVTEINNIEYRWGDWTDSPDPAWFDPNRKLVHYNQNLGGEASTIAFLEAAAKRPLRTLWPDYSAEAVIGFFKDGFSTDLVDSVPPSAPDTIEVFNISDVSAELKWSYGIDDQRTTGYNIYLEGTLYNDEPVRSLKHKVADLTPETGYTVWVRSVDAGGNESDDSIQVQFTTQEADTEAPSEPANLVLAARADESISLSWDPSTDNYAVNGYKIYLDGMAVQDLLPPEPYVTVTGLTHSTEYTFKVTAVDNSGNESGFSNELVARTVDTEKPGSPQNVHITSATDSTISLAWDAATDNVGVVIYYVFVNGSLTDSSVTTEITLTGLEAGTKYSMNVGALDAEGNKSRNSPPLVVQSLSTDDQADHPGVTIYPVPVKRELFIEAADPVFSVGIFDLTGRKRVEYRAGISGQLHLTLPDMPEGIYLVRIIQEEKTRIYRIIIEQ